MSIISKSDGWKTSRSSVEGSSYCSQFQRRSLPRVPATRSDLQEGTLTTSSTPFFEKQQEENDWICKDYWQLYCKIMTLINLHMFVREFLLKSNTVTIVQLTYSPDIAPCNSFSFPMMKKRGFNDTE